MSEFEPSRLSPKNYALQVVKKVAGVDAWQRAAKEPPPNNDLEPAMAFLQITAPLYAESSLNHESDVSLKMRLACAADMCIQLGTFIALYDNLNVELALGLKLAYNTAAATVPDAARMVVNKIGNRDKGTTTLIV